MGLRSNKTSTHESQSQTPALYLTVLHLLAMCVWTSFGEYIRSQSQWPCSLDRPLKIDGQKY